MRDTQIIIPDVVNLILSILHWLLASAEYSQYLCIQWLAQLYVYSGLSVQIFEPVNKVPETAVEV